MSTPVNPKISHLGYESFHFSEEKEEKSKKESDDITAFGTTIIHEIANSSANSDSSESPAFGTTVIKDFAKENQIDLSKIDLTTFGTPPLSIDQKKAVPHGRIPSLFGKDIYSKTKEEAAKELVRTPSQKHVLDKMHLHSHMVPKGIQKPLNIMYKKPRRRNIPSLLVSQTKVYGSKPKRAKLSESGKHEIDYMQINPKDVPGGPIIYPHPAKMESCENIEPVYEGSPVETAEKSSTVSEKTKPTAKKQGFWVGLFQKVHSFAMKVFSNISKGFYKVASFFGIKLGIKKAKVETGISTPESERSCRDMKPFLNIKLLEDG